MNKNYERYCNVSPKKKKRRSLMSYLVGRVNSIVVSKAVRSIEGKKILELGAGTGRYTRYYYKKNHVKCIDINPHLFTLDDVEIMKGDACRFGELLKPNEKYDYIFSFFMTEYIDEESLEALLQHCSSHLNKDGRLLCTFITKGLIGKLYIFGARLKGIKKYNYSHDKIVAQAHSAGLKEIKHYPIKRFMFEMGRLYELGKRGVYSFLWIFYFAFDTPFL